MTAVSLWIHRSRGEFKRNFICPDLVTNGFVIWITKQICLIRIYFPFGSHNTKTWKYIIPANGSQECKNCTFALHQAPFMSLEFTYLEIWQRYTAFCDVMQYSLVENYWCFAETCFFHVYLQTCKMEARVSSKASVNFYHTTQCHIKERQYSSESLQSELQITPTICS